MLLSTMVIPAQNNDEYDYFLVEFDGYAEQWMKNEVAKLGGEILEYRQRDTYLVRMDTTEVMDLNSLPYISEVCVIRAQMKVSPDLEEPKGVVKLRINVYQGSDMDLAVESLRELAPGVYDVSDAAEYYILCNADATSIDDIAAIKDISWIQQEFEPQTLMNLISMNAYLGTDTPQSFGWAGAGILAEVQDDGCERTHPDMGQVIYTDFSPGVASHGTSTTGIVFGDGTGDIDALGHAYQATGAFCDWGNGNALAIEHLWNGQFDQGSAGMNGVVQTNSWWNGATMDGEYDAMSNELDQAIVDYPKVLTHWAIGNSNHGEAKGLMSAESISKNNMAVGAIFHFDTASMADDDWHSAGSGSTPSRGPSADGRMKPDMLAMFDMIYTTTTGGGYRTNFGGTSGATPNVAGCSVIAYDMYIDNFFDNNPTNEIPYSPTIKALMIADAQQYPMPNGDQIDRDCQGWGAPDMENMYNLGATYHVIEEYPQALNAGDTWTRQVYSDGTVPLKITVAWIDPAAPSTTLSGRALINNLNLRVVSPGGTTYYGNNGLYVDEWSASGTGANHWYNAAAPGANYNDNLNNVENVFIQTPASGVYTIEVSGQTGDIGSGPQDFSMVASGAQGISSMGTIALDKAVYLGEDTAIVSVSDLDLNTLPGVAESVTVNVDSTTEPAGESLILTETGPDTSTFENTITLSQTDGAGILWVSHGDTVTATYNDADDGTGSPAVVTDTATVDTQVAPPTGLTVNWDGSPLETVVYEDFEDAMTPEWSTYESNPAVARNMRDTYAAAAGSYSWRMDVNTDNNYNLNELILQFDGTAYNDLQLYFQTMQQGEETNPMSANFVDHENSEGIAVSDDGVNWVRLWTYQYSTSFIPYGPFDIDALIPIDSTMYIKFQQYDNFALPTDGILWDEIEIIGTKIAGGGTEDNRLNWFLSADDGAGANDVSVYNIYRANNEFGPWDMTAYLDSVPAGTTEYWDWGVGEFDGINWWYVVRAEDMAGNEDTNTNAVPEIPPGNVPPSIPTNPVPAHMAVGIGLNPTLSVDVADPNGDPMDVAFYDASGPTLIGTDFGVLSGGTASVTWPGLSADTTYNWYAEAYDGEFYTSSPTWQFTTMDTTPPAPPTGLTVEWWGVTSMTWIDENFGAGVPPTGWNVYTSGTTGTWGPSGTNNAGGTAPEAMFTYGASGTGTSIMYAGPFDTSGLTTMDLQWQNMIDDYDAGTGVRCSIRTSTDGSTWTEDGWFWDDTITPGDLPANLETLTVTTNVGSSSFYIGWAVTGNSWQLNYWYIDDVLLTSTGGGTTDDNWLNWTLSSDDGGGANDVSQYNIYRAINSAGPWDAAAYIDSVPAGTDTYMDYGFGQPDGINWWYVVRAEDIWGNEELNTNAVPEIPVGDMPPTVTVDSPNGGEVYPANSMITIDWTALDDNPWGPTPNCWIYYDDDTNPGNGETFITNAVGAGIGTYTWDATGVPAGTYYIHIVVEDGISQTAEDWSNGFFTILPPVYNIDLTGFGAGDWVFVSYPVEATGNVLTVFDDAGWGDGQTDWDIAMWFDNVNKLWRSFSIHRPPSVNDWDIFDNTMGVWLHLTTNGGDQQLTIGTGNLPIVGVNINLYTGWNLVSYPSATPRLGSATLPPEADLMAIYDGVQPYLILDVLPTTTPMSEGNAYWVHVTADTVWTVNP